MLFASQAPDRPHLLQCAAITGVLLEGEAGRETAPRNKERGGVWPTMTRVFQNDGLRAPFNVHSFISEGRSCMSAGLWNLILRAGGGS
jgi:hypothetical protein